MIPTQAPYVAGTHPIMEKAEIGWVYPETGIILRYAQWTGGHRGTIHILMGRAEAIEKYADIIADFINLGYSITCHDWRGQGLSSRAPEIGILQHIKDFSSYQLDLEAVMRQAHYLPSPRIIFSHDIGGIIARRYLMTANNIDSAIYSAPIWRAHLSPLRRKIAKIYIHYNSDQGSLYKRFIGTHETPYELNVHFRHNYLTSDPVVYGKIRKFLRLFPEFSTGGPTYFWARALHRESVALGREILPDIPSLVLFAEDERFGDNGFIFNSIEAHPSYRHVTLPKAKHDIYIENAAIRAEMSRHIQHFLLGRVAKISRPEFDFDIAANILA